MLQTPDYWNLVDEAAARFGDDNEGYAAFVTKALSQRDYCDRYRFSQYTGAYMMLGECAGIMSLCKILNGGFSDDSLLYFTLWVISRGRDFFNKAAKNPDLLTEALMKEDRYREFECFMSLGMDFEEESDSFSDEEIAQWNLTAEEVRELEKDIEYLNGEKNGGYKSIDAMIQEIPTLLPKLCAKFGYENELADENEKASEDDREKSFLAWQKTRQDAVVHLEQQLNTKLQETETWKKDMLRKELPAIVGVSFVQPFLYKNDVFIASNLYIRKKKAPAAIVGYSLTNQDSTVFYQDSREMLYKFVDRTDENIYFTGRYSGGISPEEVEGFITQILVFDNDMKLISDFEFPCNNMEFAEGGCFWQGYLYSSVRKITGGPKNMLFIQQIDLDLKQPIKQLDGFHTPVVHQDNLYLLKENEDYKKYNVFDLYKMDKTLKTPKLIMQRVKQCASTNKDLVLIVEEDNTNKVLLLKEPGLIPQQVFTMGDCKMGNISATDEIIGFDLFAIGGSHACEKLTVFYHMATKQFRLMEADFLYGSFMAGGGFSRFYKDKYIGFCSDWQGEQKAEHKMYLADTQNLF
ncbi:MAG: DUF4240 domain-containing protein [Oscillospiraceae bacterium]